VEKIGFIGGFEKTDLILCVAKILVETGKKVLVVDTTITQRARYIVPCITPSVYYVTEYEGIDVAIGFESLEKVSKYLGVAELAYDLVLLDIDSHEAFTAFKMCEAEKNFFVTAFDNYSLKKGLEAIGQIDKEVNMTKVLFSKEMLDEEDDYLNFLSFYFSVKWADEKIFFPYDQGANTVFIYNQRISQIRFRDFDQTYKDGFMMLANLIVPTLKGGDLKKAMKKLL